MDRSITVDGIFLSVSLKSDSSAQSIVFEIGDSLFERLLWLS